MTEEITSLVLTRFRPDRPAGGGALRNRQNISALATLGPVDVVSIGVSDPATPLDGIRRWDTFPLGRDAGPDNLARRVAHRLWPVRRGRHPVLDRHFSPRVALWLRQRLARERYDLIVVEELALAVYFPVLRGCGARLVFDAHNVESGLREELAVRGAPLAKPWRTRLLERLLSRRLLEAEQSAVGAADLVWVCSEHDAHELQRIYRPRAAVTVVPNGVDVPAYRRPSVIPAGAAWPDAELTLAYPGAYSYFPNEDAALRLVREVLPAVRERGAEARVMLIGRDPTPAMLAAAQADPHVRVTGAVESVLPFLEQPCVVTLPLAFGSGTRLKILEAFAVGRPVVSTRKGAEGLDAQDGQHLLLRETPVEQAEAVVQLWRSPELRDRLCRNAFELVERRYSWSEAAIRIQSSVLGDPIPA